MVNMAPRPAHEDDDAREEAFVGMTAGDMGDAREVMDLHEEDGEDAGSESEDGEHDAQFEAYVDDSIHTFEGHQDGIYAVAWNSARADMVATGGADDVAFLWRVGAETFVPGGPPHVQLEGHTDTVVSLAFSADGALLASGAMDGTVRVWSADTGECLQVLEGPGDAVDWVAWHPRGAVVLAGAEDCTAWMWDGRSGAWMGTFSGHTGAVNAGGFSPDGRAVVTAGADGALRVWNPKEAVATLAVSGHPFHDGAVTCLALAPDGASALTGGEDGVAKITSLAAGRIVTTLDPGASSSSPALAGDDEDDEMTAAYIEAVAWVPALPGVAVTGGLDGRLVVWEAASANPRAVCRHPDGITRLCVHPRLPVVITACIDGRVRVWEARTGACLATLEGCEGAVQDLALSPDGAMVLAGSEDGAARVFDLREALAACA